MKRRRVGFVVRVSRPIDKKIVIVSKNGTAATQATTTLFTATFPCTLFGLRWNGAVMQNAGTGFADFKWVIVIVRDGQTISTLGVSDAADLYQPEQHVLAFGAGMVDNNVEVMELSGSTKTMRKMQLGDTLVFVIRNIATDTVNTRVAVQFFCKT